MHPLDRFGFDFSDEQKQIYDAMLRFGLEDLHTGAQDRDRSHSFPSTFKLRRWQIWVDLR